MLAVVREPLAAVLREQQEVAVDPLASQQDLPIAGLETNAIDPSRVLERERAVDVVTARPDVAGTAAEMDRAPGQGRVVTALREQHHVAVRAVAPKPGVRIAALETNAIVPLLLLERERAADARTARPDVAGGAAEVDRALAQSRVVTALREQHHVAVRAVAP